MLKVEKKTGSDRNQRRKGFVLIALLATALLVAAVLAVSPRWWLTPTAAVRASVPKEAGAKVDVRAKARNASQQQLPADVTMTTLNSTGFSPTEIAHEAGRFRIVVQNKSGVPDLDLRLDGEQSSRWVERHELGEIQGWVATVELAAGRYTITEAAHPKWICHLTVQ